VISYQRVAERSRHTGIDRMVVGVTACRLAPDNRAVGKAQERQAVLVTLYTEGRHIGQGWPWQNLIAAQSSLQSRPATLKLEQAGTLGAIRTSQAESTWILNATVRWAQQDRDDGHGVHQARSGTEYIGAVWRLRSCATPPCVPAQPARTSPPVFRSPPRAAGCAAVSPPDSVRRRRVVTAASQKPLRDSVRSAFE
jgi:hypothetical protein